jgi:hypothetical protein
MIVLEEYVVRPEKRTRLFQEFWRIFTLLFILFEFVMFNADNITHAVQYYCSMFHLEGNRIIDDYGIYWVDQYKVFIVFGAILSFPVMEAVTSKLEKAGNTVMIRLLEGVKLLSMTAMLAACILYAVAGGYNPFIYFNF